MSNAKKFDPSVIDETTIVDELDEQLDYEGIVARSEADRLAGRVLSHDEVRARTSALLASFRTERRSA